MKRRIKINPGYPLNRELLTICAYYPRPRVFGRPSPCETCKPDEPNWGCKRAYIFWVASKDVCDICWEKTEEVRQVYGKWLCPGCYEYLLELLSSEK